MPHQQANSRLKLAGLTQWKHHTFEMSGGQQQRVAIARVLASHLSFMLADEPIGELNYLDNVRLDRCSNPA